MPDQNEWEKQAANLLKSELKRKGVTYAQLVEKLGAIGISEKEVNVANKLSRGKFSAAFMLVCLKSIGSSHWGVSPLHTLLRNQNMSDTSYRWFGLRILGVSSQHFWCFGLLSQFVILPSKDGLVSQC